MSNLRTYINLIEERGRIDRSGNPFDSADKPTASNPNISTSTDPKQDWKPTTGGAYNAAGYGAPIKTLGGLPKTKAAVKPAGSTEPKTAEPKTAAPRQATKPVAKASAVPPARQGSQPVQAAKAKTTAPKPAYSGSQYGYQSPEDVKGIQQMLVNMGYNMPVDGKWGPKTDAAYKTAYQQMYGSAPGQGQSAASTDPNVGGGFVTGTAKTGPSGTTTFTNTPQGKPDAWTQAKVAKQGQSADMAAAVGMPNPYVKPGAATAPATAKPAANPNSPFYIPPNTALDSARAKAAKDPRYDNLYDPMGVHAGEKSLEESDLNRIKDLVNYKK